MGLSLEEIAAEYELKLNRVQEARAFYQAHKPEIDSSILAEKRLEENHG